MGLHCGVGLALGSLLLAGVGCAAPSEQNAAPTTALTSPILPTQVKNWEAVTDFAMRYPGKTLSISGDLLLFSAAGNFKLHYAGAYGNGQLFSIVAQSQDSRIRAAKLCGGTVATFIALMPGKLVVIHSPVITFEVFSGRKQPQWKDRTITNNNCETFTYGYPIKTD